MIDDLCIPVDERNPKDRKVGLTPEIDRYLDASKAATSQGQTAGADSPDGRAASGSWSSASISIGGNFSPAASGSSISGSAGSSVTGSEGSGARASLADTSGCSGIPGSGTGSGARSSADEPEQSKELFGVLGDIGAAGGR